MSGEAKTAISKEVLWGGGRSPFSVSYGKMMMWYFLVSDALTFGGLLIAYAFWRASSVDPWPIGEQAFRALPGLEGEYPLAYVALMTFILIVSSVTMVLAVEAGHRNDRSGVLKWMGTHRHWRHFLLELSSMGVEPLHSREWRDASTLPKK